MSDFVMEIRTARKDHRCLSCDAWIESGYGLLDATERCRPALIAAEADGWQVKAGQRYYRCTRFEGGTAQSHAQRIDMTDVCVEMGWYE